MTLSFTCLELFNHQFLEVVICFQIPSDWIKIDVSRPPTGAAIWARSNVCFLYNP